MGQERCDRSSRADTHPPLLVLVALIGCGVSSSTSATVPAPSTSQYPIPPYYKTGDSIARYLAEEYTRCAERKVECDQLVSARYALQQHAIYTSTVAVLKLLKFQIAATSKCPCPTESLDALAHDFDAAMALALSGSRAGITEARQAVASRKMVEELTVHSQAESHCLKAMQQCHLEDQCVSELAGQEPCSSADVVRMYQDLREDRAAFDRARLWWLSSTLAGSQTRWAGYGSRDRWQSFGSRPLDDIFMAYAHARDERLRSNRVGLPGPEVLQIPRGVWGTALVLLDECQVAAWDDTTSKPVPFLRVACSVKNGADTSVSYRCRALIYDTDGAPVVSQDGVDVPQLSPSSRHILAADIYGVPADALGYLELVCE
jgi:hypothetical protein